MPPPVAITRQLTITRFGERGAFHRTEVRLAIVGEDRGDAFPACAAMRSSRSRNDQRNHSASARPVVVLPAPGKPIRKTR